MRKLPFIVVRASKIECRLWLTKNTHAQTTCGRNCCSCFWWVGGGMVGCGFVWCARLGSMGGWSTRVNPAFVLRGQRTASVFLNPLCGRVFLWLHFRKPFRGRVCRRQGFENHFPLSPPPKKKHTNVTGGYRAGTLKHSAAHTDVGRRVRGKSPVFATTFWRGSAGGRSVLPGQLVNNIRFFG